MNVNAILPVKSVFNGELKHNGENVETLSLFFYLVHVGESTFRKFEGPYPSLGQERENHCLELTSSLNRKIRKISLERRAVTAKKCTKKCDAPEAGCFV